MSSGNIADYLIFKQMPPGRHVFALSESKRIAGELRATRLTTLAETAMELGQAALDTEFAWARDKNQAQGRGQAQVVKNRIARQLSSIRDIAYGRSGADAGDEDDEAVAAAARELLETCFPNGVDVIANQPYEVLLGTLETMNKKLEGELSTQIETLALGREVRGLSRLTASLRAELQPKNRDIVDFDDVTDARDALHEATCRFIVAVLDDFSGSDDESARERERLLAPLNAQQAYVAQVRGRRREPLDVDPVTGEEVVRGEDPAGPGPAAS